MPARMAALTRCESTASLVVVGAPSGYTLNDRQQVLREHRPHAPRLQCYAFDTAKELITCLFRIRPDRNIEGGRGRR